MYAQDNGDFVVTAKPNNPGAPTTPPFVQIAIFAPNTNAIKATGIPLQTNAPSVWSCPNIPGLPWPDTANDQWIIGYQYLGGFTKWSPPTGTITGTHSPVKLSTSLPYWCLAADLVMKIDSVWGNPDTLLPTPAQRAFRSAPQHRSGGKKYPEGGNEVFVDCSARFCKVESMDPGSRHGARAVGSFGFTRMWLRSPRRANSTASTPL